MRKPNKICSECRKPKKEDCDKCKKPAFEGISRENQQLYNSSKWRRRSKSYKRRNPLCVKCLTLGRTSAAEVTDHIVPILQGGDPWDESNWQSLCHTCHNRKSGSQR